MNFETQLYIVFIKADDQNRIQAVNSSAFLRDTDGWIEIDTGYQTRHYHAQGNYFPQPIYDERGIMRYMTAPIIDDPDREPYHVYGSNGERLGIYERTQAEMDADWEEPVPQPDQTGRITALEEQIAAYEAAYAEGVNEA